MNRNFNLQDQIQDMHFSLRRAVLNSLVNSINATLVGEASRIVDELDGLEFNELEPKDIVAMLMSNETGPTPPAQRVNDIRLLTALAEVWRTDLQTLSNDDTQGSFQGTLQFMTGKQRTRAMTGLDTLKALGIECSEEDNKRSAALQLGRDQMRADALSQKRGHIEWLYEKVFTTLDVGNSGDYWDALSEPRREQLASKAMQALNTTFNQAVDNIKFGRTGNNMLGAADIVLIKDWIPKINAAFLNEPVEKPKKMRRVKKEDLTKELSA